MSLFLKASVKVNVVLEAQESLNPLGYNADPADCIIGKKTHDAIIFFSVNTMNLWMVRRLLCDWESLRLQRNESVLKI